MVTRELPGVASGPFDRALAAAAADDQDESQIADTLSALAKIICVNAPAVGNLRRVVQLARAYMTSDSPMVWQIAVDLALATGDRDLRAIVTQVAAGTLEPAFAARHGLQLWVRSAAQRALDRHRR